MMAWSTISCRSRSLDSFAFPKKDLSFESRGLFKKTKRQSGVDGALDAIIDRLGDGATVIEGFRIGDPIIRLRTPIDIQERTVFGHVHD